MNVWIDVHLVLFSAEAILRQSSFERGGYGVILLLMVEFLIKTGLIIVITIQAIVTSFSDICVVEKGKYYVETDSSYMVVFFCLAFVWSEFD